MSGHINNLQAKMTRTIGYPTSPLVSTQTNAPTNALVNAPAGAPVNPPASHYTLNQSQDLQARNLELEHEVQKLRSLLTANMKEVRDEMAVVRDCLKATREHNAKLQGEMAALNKPRRRTNLRRENEESRDKIVGLEENLRNMKNENVQLRGLLTDAHKDRDGWKLRFEEAQHENENIQNSQALNQTNFHPTPPQNNVGAFEPIQTLPFMNVNFMPQVPVHPTAPAMAPGVGFQYGSAAPIYNSPESINEQQRRASTESIEQQFLAPIEPASGSLQGLIDPSNMHLQPPSEIELPDLGIDFNWEVGSLHGDNLFGEDPAAN
ncbi:uncharacterized protein GGS25DRAFT_521266 [Hypoxylon fragiforme]|uniref:uncharacterized protein n=1 Tax=Hypoxylon fragiforme TaxID=63214 RepID=UPI0020C63EA8|nr:uncharacterized protein GGS25DRAFT_521266 [Hypoxylon fragiforme]KAI2608099.1 hypothetical protein GGS25DRAFT_521266 [Hypoxylon fragiforme]